MSDTLLPEVRARLDAHLDAVEAALAGAGTPRERRRGVVDDLEAQILDMLGNRASPAQLGDIDAVLAGMDPPAAYGVQGAEVRGARGVEGMGSGPAGSAPFVPAAAGGAFAVPVAVGPRYSRTAVAGFVCIVLSFFALLPMGLVAAYSTAHVSRARAGAAAMAADQKAAREIGRDGPEGVTATRRNEFEPVAENPEMAGNVRAAQANAEQIAGRAGVAQKSWGVAICVLLPLLPLALVGTVLGWVAFFQIRGSGGKLRGTGLALFDGLFYPVAGVVVLGVVMA